MRKDTNETRLLSIHTRSRLEKRFSTSSTSLLNNDSTNYKKIEQHNLEKVEDTFNLYKIEQLTIYALKTAGSNYVEKEILSKFGVASSNLC